MCGCTLAPPLLLTLIFNLIALGTLAFLLPGPALWGLAVAIMLKVLIGLTKASRGRVSAFGNYMRFTFSTGYAALQPNVLRSATRLALLLITIEAVALIRFGGYRQLTRAV